MQKGGLLRTTMPAFELERAQERLPHYHHRSKEIETYVCIYITYNNIYI